MRAYERLLKYVVVHTCSDEKSGQHPSSAIQFDLARMLVEEMKELGLSNVRLDEHCYVYGDIPATPGCEDKPTLGLIAHMDTAPAFSGENVRPVIHENYNGEDVTLPDGTVLAVDKFPFLAKLKGQTLITTDGTTLLGADDKAGIAEILTAVEEIMAEGKPHGKLCVAFTPDEEIGEGSDFFDIPGFGADFAYTVDGGEVGELEFENFNAYAAHVKVKGFSVHPGSSKDKMINACNVAAEFHTALPAMERPEHTELREGFFHLMGMEGDVTAARLEYILRDHDEESMECRKRTMALIAKRLNEKYGEGTVELELELSYRNMVEQIKPHFHLIENARKAIRAVGLEPLENPCRGGTDGAQLSWKGLPCPNLGTGGFNFHSPGECITVESMDKSVAILKNIVAIYAD